MSNPATQASVLARLVTDGGTARRLFDALMEEAGDAFEVRPGESELAIDHRRAAAWARGTVKLS